MKSSFPYGIYLAVVVVFAAFVALNSLHSYLDTDTWWHLRIGKVVCETQSVPQTDPISRHGIENRVPWRAYSWLFEVALYQVHALGGITGIMWFKTVLTAFSSATVFAFVLRQTGTTLAGFGVLAGMALLVYPMGSERPWHITIPFTVLTLWKTIQIRDGEPFGRGWWLIPMFILWANTHIQFVLGWGILGLAFLFPGRAQRWQFACLLAATVLATIVNPYHLWLFQVIWEYATQNALRALIQELQRPDFTGRFAIATALLLVAALVRWLTRKPWDGFEFCLLLAGAYFASRMTRDLWFGGLVAVAVLHAPRELSISTKRLWATFGTVVLVYFLMRSLYCLGLLRSNDYATSHAEKYPVKAVEFLRATQPKGPIFNSFNWGGYLSWELPQYPVSMDGRTNLYGNQLLLTSWDTWDTKDGWKIDPTFHAANIALIDKDTVLRSVLKEQPECWDLVYDDETCSVFLRKPGTTP